MELVRVAQRDGAGQLVVDGSPFRFILVNAYYLQEEAARGRLELVDETLSKCRQMGVTVVRAWAFNDDPHKLDTRIQQQRLTYAAAGLIGLDRLLERARAHGLRLILPLVNYWNAYGGVRQWLAWNGIADATEGDGRFFTEPRLRVHYAAHVEELLGRRNRLTGVVYRDDPTVLAWELMNEPRGRGLDGEGRLLGDWVAFAARTVKAAGARQLVAIGDEGEEVSFAGYDEPFWRSVGGAHLFSPTTGTSFSRQIACPDVDLATIHLYPESMGLLPYGASGARWIVEHARVAARLGKPLVVAEMGLRSALLPSERRAIYRHWFAAAAAAGVAGIGPWLFAYDARPAAWDEFTFYFDPEDAEGDVALLCAAARRLGDPSG